MASQPDAKTLLNDFVLLDHRVEDHPRLSGCVYWNEKGILAPRFYFGRSRSNYPSILSVPHFNIPDGGHYYVEGFDGHVDASFVREMSINRAIRDQVRATTGMSMELAVIGRGSGIQGIIAVQVQKPSNWNIYDTHKLELLGSLLQYALQLIGSDASQHGFRDTGLAYSLRVVRERLGHTQGHLSKVIGCEVTELERWERGEAAPDLQMLYNWCLALGLLTQHSSIVRVVEVTPEVMRFLRRDPSEMRNLSPEAFEHLVANRLERMGFAVKLTGRSTWRDGGIDILAIPNHAPLGGFLLATQVKHHQGQQKTGREAVDRLLSWKNSGFSFGLLVTNTTFSRDALWAAKQTGNQTFLRLRDFEDLKRWLEDEFSSDYEWREIPSEIELAPGVWIKVPRP